MVLPLASTIYSSFLLFCRPCILIFDSLAGASRSRVVATLRDYLRIEYKVKEGKDREFNKDTIKGSTPRVPQQTNFTDCGLYVLQYVENFFQVMLSKFSVYYLSS
jgi:sentrin-specific protease 7